MTNIQSNAEASLYLKERPFRGFAYSLHRTIRFPKQIANRLLAIYGFFLHKFSVKEALMLILPASMKSEELRTKYLEFVASEISRTAKRHLKPVLNADGSINLFGHPFYPSNDNYGEMIELVEQVILLDQYDLKRFIKDGDVVIDAGANIGTFSVFASNVRKDIKIFAFEPVQKTWETLKKNTSAYTNIHCINSGLGETNTSKKIYYGKNSTVGSAFDEQGSEHSSQELFENAKIMTIDGYVDAEQITRLDFIKMDTEGYERQIINGAKNALKRFKPILAVSAYHKAGDKEVLPAMVRSIEPTYGFELKHADEEDLIFIPQSRKEILDK